MTDICSLERTLNKTLPWNKSRIKFISQFIPALFKARTVNLQEISNLLDNSIEEESRYRKVRRFFSGFVFDYLDIARLVLQIIFIQGPFTLTIDRTNWKFGKKDINIFMLALAHNGVAFPLFWTLLDKRGNSNTKERIALLKRFINAFGKDSIQSLLGDREFIGEEWFKFLIEEGIYFQMRIKRNTKIPKQNGELTQAWKLFEHLTKHQPRTFKKPKKIWKQELYLTGMKIEKGDYLILVSPTLSYWAIEEYSKRWEIETLFGCLKKRGFRLEETHLTERLRIKKLVAVLAIAFCWAYKIGEWRNEIKPLKTKSHKRLEKSIFRYGFDLIRNVLTASEPVRCKSQLVDFKLLVSFLSGT